jgi:hypothetical protein
LLSVSTTTKPGAKMISGQHSVTGMTAGSLRQVRTHRESLRSRAHAQTARRGAAAECRGPPDDGGRRGTPRLVRFLLALMFNDSGKNAKPAATPRPTSGRRSETPKRPAVAMDDMDEIARRLSSFGSGLDEQENRSTRPVMKPSTSRSIPTCRATLLNRWRQAWLGFTPTGLPRPCTHSPIRSATFLNCGLPDLPPRPRTCGPDIQLWRFAGALEGHVRAFTLPRRHRYRARSTSDRFPIPAYRPGEPSPPRIQFCLIRSPR